MLVKFVVFGVVVSLNNRVVVGDILLKWRLECYINVQMSVVIMILFKSFFFFNFYVYGVEG